MIGDLSPFNILLPVLIAGAVAGRGFRVDEDYAERWATHFGLHLQGENRALVRRYLLWTRRCRTAGGLAGFLAPTFYYEIVTTGPPPDDVGALGITFMFVGYLLGALCAETVIDPPWERSQGVGAGRGSLGDYLPGYALVLQRGLGFAALPLVGLYALSESQVRGSFPDVAQVAAFGAAATCAAVVTEAFQRRIVARPGPGWEAMKTSSLLVLTGGAIALLTNIVGSLLLLSVLTFTGWSSPPAWISLALFGFLFLWSIYFWLYFGKPGGFGIRRRARHEATA
jgi:hypothetical protein